MPSMKGKLKGLKLQVMQEILSILLTPNVFNKLVILHITLWLWLIPNTSKLHKVSQDKKYKNNKTLSHEALILKYYKASSFCSYLIIYLFINYYIFSITFDIFISDINLGQNICYLNQNLKIKGKFPVVVGFA